MNPSHPLVMIPVNAFEVSYDFFGRERNRVIKNVFFVGNGRAHEDVGNTEEPCAIFRLKGSRYFHFFEEPGTRVSPVAIGRALGDAKDLRGLPSWQMDKWKAPA